MTGKCNICFEQKKITKFPCTCNVYLCKDCWYEQREKNMDCLICHKPFPMFIEWRKETLSIEFFKVLILVSLFSLVIGYEAYCSYYAFGIGIYYILATIAICMFTNNIYSCDFIYNLFTGEDNHTIGVCTGVGVALGLLHHYMFFYGYSIFNITSLFFWFCLPVIAFNCMVVSQGLCLATYVFLLMSGFRVDVVRPSDFQ